MRQLRQRKGQRPNITCTATQKLVCSERTISLDPHFGHIGGRFFDKAIV